MEFNAFQTHLYHNLSYETVIIDDYFRFFDIVPHTLQLGKFGDGDFYAWVLGNGLEPTLHGQYVESVGLIVLKVRGSWRSAILSWRSAIIYLGVWTYLWLCSVLIRIGKQFYTSQATREKHKITQIWAK